MPNKNVHINIIDMSKPIEAIIQKYGDDYHRNDSALKEIAELWGFPVENGKITTRYQTESIVNTGSCNGSIYLAKSNKGYWLVGMEACTPVSGCSHAPSIFNRTGFDTYEDARLTGILNLEHFFERITNDSTVSKSAKYAAEQALGIIRQAKQPQLDLFLAHSDNELDGGMRGR